MTLILEIAQLPSGMRSSFDGKRRSSRFGCGLMFGLLGGYLGTVLMDLVMVLTFIAAGASPDMFFSLVGAKFGQGPATGLVIHNVIGMTAGILFALVVLHCEARTVSGVRNGLRIGLVVGAVTIFMGCIPMALWLGESIPLVLAFAAVPHLVWGSVTGMVMGCWMCSPQLESPRKVRASIELG